MRNARSLLPVVAVLVLLMASSTARAQQDQQAIIDKVVQLNRDGVAQYQKKRFEAARKTLKQALDLCEANGLDRHPVAARTHVHMGIVIIGGFGQREIGSKQFALALQIQPDITLTPGVATPAIQDVFNEQLVAVSPRAPLPPPAAAAAETDAPAAEAPAAQSAPAAEAPAAEAPAAASDDERPPDLEHKRTPEEEAATAPAPRPAAETVVKEKGDDDDDDDSALVTARSRIQIGAMLGSGFGWASGMGDVNADTPIEGGFAAAKLGHIAAEAGYWMTPKLMLSVQGRFQIVSGPTVIEHNGHTWQPASGATAMFAAVTYSPSPIAAHLRPFVTASLGGGRIRHVVTLQTLRDCGPTHMDTCVDTVGGGLFLAGLGGGLNYALGDTVGLVAAINTQLGAPNFTFNVDFNAGVAFHL